MTRRRIYTTILYGLVVLAMAGCASKLPDPPAPLDASAVEAAVSRGDGIDPASFAGEFAMKAPLDIPTKTTSVPVVLYAGLSPEGENRIKVRSVVDLRILQLRLPELLSGTIKDSCKHQFALDFSAADVQEDGLRAWGTVNARFFRCQGDEEDVTARGRQRLSAQIDAFVLGSVEIVDQCAVVRLRDVQLSPRGFLGGLANLFGLTQIARSAILKDGAAFLEENPLCPPLPEELAPLAPRYDSVGPLEVKPGGVGAQLTGSVDTSAATLISLLILMEESGIVEEAR